MAFTPEESLNAFTIDIRFRGNAGGNLLSFKNGTRGKTTGTVSFDETGCLNYQSPVASREPVVSAEPVSGDEWHHMTLTHYYAWGKTFLYIDGNQVGSVTDKLTPGKFTIGDATASREIGEISLWRAGMTPEEIKKHVAGTAMLKSSLELYTPCSEADTEQSGEAEGYIKLPNLAQSLNAIEYDRGNSLSVESAAEDDVIASCQCLQRHYYRGGRRGNGCECSRIRRTPRGRLHFSRRSPQHRRRPRGLPGKRR